MVPYSSPESKRKRRKVSPLLYSSAVPARDVTYEFTISNKFTTSDQYLVILIFLPRSFFFFWTETVEVHVGEENDSVVPMEVEDNTTPFPVEDEQTSQTVDEIPGPSGFLT